jgi:hypothetical protein
LGVFNEENLFACGRDFRLGHSPPMHSAPVCGAAGGNDLEFIVARQRLLRSNNNVRAAHHASNVALVCERVGDNRVVAASTRAAMASENCAKGFA